MRRDANAAGRFLVPAERDQGMLQRGTEEAQNDCGGMGFPDLSSSNAAPAVHAELARARRVAATLTNAADRAIIEAYIRELCAQTGRSEWESATLGCTWASSQPQGS